MILQSHSRNTLEFRKPKKTKQLVKWHLTSPRLKRFKTFTKDLQLDEAKKISFKFIPNNNMKKKIDQRYMKKDEELNPMIKKYLDFCHRSLKKIAFSFIGNGSIELQLKGDKLKNTLKQCYNDLKSITKFIDKKPSLTRKYSTQYGFH